MGSFNERLGFWGPGIWLARQARLPLKLGSVCAVLLIPLLVVAVLLIQKQSNEVFATHSKTEGIVVIRPLVRVVTLVQKHRGQSNLLLSGDVSIQPALDKTRQELAQASTDTLAAIKAATTFEQSVPWQPLAARLQRLASETQSTPAPASFKHHSELVRDLQQFMRVIGESSNLIYDPDHASYMLMDMVVLRIVPWTEQLAQLRGFGAGLLARAQPDPAGDAAMRVRLGQMSDLLAHQRFDMDVLKRSGESGEAGDAAIEASERFLRLADGLFGGVESPSRDAAAFFSAGSSAIDSVLAAHTQTTDRLDLILKHRASNMEQLGKLLTSGGVLGLLMLLYILITFYKSLMIDLRRVSYAMSQLAQGNLRVTGTLRGKDEIADLEVLLKLMISNVSAMVAAVGSDAALVAHVGQSLSLGNQDLSDRTEQQAANLEETSASVQDLAHTVEQNAGIAGHVAQQAREVRDIAEAGSVSMIASIESVEAIQKSAHRMDEIIGVIDGLAFQTNILALNAAVEAARAGDSGRGFAVVASEVRSLAKRSAESAREIRGLIQSSRSQVETSVTQIRSAGDGMDRILSGIRGVSASISQISTASADQSTGIREISEAVKQLDEITQQNALMVEHAVNESNRLGLRAGSLSAAIGSFKLQQGVAGEAMALVARAVDERKRCSSRDAFLRHLTEKSNKFYDRDMYVFALDAQGTYLAFGGNPAKVGTHVSDVPGIDANGLTRDIAAQCAVGPGWVEYDITNPDCGKVQHKMSFVQTLDGVYLGCGIYRALA